MTTHLLPHEIRVTTRHPPLRLGEDIALVPGRAHEICGPARHTLALMLASQAVGPIWWLQPAWSSLRLNGDGLLRFIDPARLVLVYPERGDDMLWTCEEVLRSGDVAVVVADLPMTPSLTAVRRLHLAAETGAASGAPGRRHVPTCLLMTEGRGVAQGVESRWHIQPAHIARESWTVSRLKARSLPPGTWELARDPASKSMQTRAAAPGDPASRLADAVVR